jgi:hypothetical protein
VCDDQFDVIRLTLSVALDQRELLKLIDALSKQNFYQCVNAEIAAVTAANTPAGYLSGTAPTVRATLDFEGYLSRAVYKPLMPTEIRKAVGAEKGDGK